MSGSPGNGVRVADRVSHVGANCSSQIWAEAGTEAVPSSAQLSSVGRGLSWAPKMVCWMRKLIESYQSTHSEQWIVWTVKSEQGTVNQMYNWIYIQRCIKACIAFGNASGGRNPGSDWNHKINLLTLLNFYKIYIFRLAAKTELKHWRLNDCDCNFDCDWYCDCACSQLLSRARSSSLPSGTSLSIRGLPIVRQTKPTGWTECSRLSTRQRDTQQGRVQWHRKTQLTSCVKIRCD